MARRKKADDALLALGIIVGLPILLLVKLYEAAGGALFFISLILIIAFIVWYQVDKKKKRLAYLRDKYANEEIVQQIIAGFIWQGQTEEQLIDALGEPAATDRQALKSKTKDIWKYHPAGVNRYKLRVIVENGQVVGWDKKA